LHSQGIVAVHDAGVGEREILLYEDLARSGELQLRVHAMLNGSDEALVEDWLQRGPELDFEGLGVLAVRAIKLYADGALGSRGALLLEDYTDEPGNHGLQITSRARLDEVCAAARAHGFQVCTHAIGDAGNRLVLDAYEAAHAPEGRWRIEHAQLLHPDDALRFARLGVIPSMQAQHQTSDMPWAEARVGPERVRGAYAWRWLLGTGCIIPGGSDAPVESLNPIAAFAAAVTRSTLAGDPPGGWHPEQRMNREEALRHLTLWPAVAAFRERDLGRIAPGTRADFVLLSADLMTLPLARLGEARVQRTYFAGRQVFPAR